jgi:hypothetical protein
MRFVAGVVVFGAVFAALFGVARAENYIQNDSSFIDFSNGSTTAPSSGDESGVGSGQGGSGAGTGSGDESDSGSGGAGGVGEGGSAIGTIIYLYPDSGNGSGGAGPDSGSGSANPSDSIEGAGSSEADASELFDTLVGNQAVSVKGGGENGSSSSWNVDVNGAAVRRALKARGVGEIAIPGFGDFSSLFSGLPSVLRTGQDFAIVAASTALKNPGIENVSLAAATLHITYRARGNLFAFIPLIYLIRIDVNPDEQNPASRIQVRFPWYKFVLQTYVSKKSIATDIEAAIAVTPKTDSVIDMRAHLLATIADSIQKRFDTVDESISSE